MKALILFLLYLSSLFVDVHSLGLSITTLVGNTAVVQWTREGLDPDPLVFDLRFVIPPYYDVGIAKASIYTSSLESSGNTSIQFPEAGRYMLVAVSGSQNNVQIGRTAAIEVSGSTLPTTILTPAPSQTPTPLSLTPSPSKSLTSTGSSCPKKLNVPAIVLAVLGGVLLTAVLIFAVFYFRRRRLTEGKRISFHRERMVQERPSDENPSVGRVMGPGGTVLYPFTGPRASLSSASVHQPDIEQGLTVPPPVMTSLSRNLSGSSAPTSGYVVPPPRGPRDRAKSVRRVESQRLAGVNESTTRQRKLADKLVEVENQISELKSQAKPLPSTIVLLDDLEMQKAWLVKQQDSMWALEEIDTPPPGYSRYMK